MDPVTQGLLGAVVGQTFMGRRLPRVGWLIAMAGGLAPDVDVFFHSETNPLIDWIYHRHFTHSLLFIPIGAALVALPFLMAKSLRTKWKDVLLASMLGYATHGLLDTATSYGTLLLWPLTSARYAWDVIGIVDLVYTPLLLVGLALSVGLRRPWIAGVVFALSLAYMGIGVINQGRALAVQQFLVEQRGHERVRGRVMPSPGSLVLWRSVYEADGRLYADGVRTPYFSESLVHTGESSPLVTKEMFEAEYTKPEDRYAYQVFSWFADDYVVAVEGEPGRYGDGRYTTEMTGFKSLWGLDVDPENGREFDRWRNVGRGGFAGRLWKLLTEGSEDFVPVDEVSIRVEEPTTPHP